MFAAIAGEVAVVAIDHRDARAHEAGDREHRDAGSQREGGVGVARVVEVAERLDAGRDLGGFPVAPPEAAEVDVAPTRVREENRVLRRRETIERLKRDRLQRNGTGAQPRLCVLEPTVSECPPHVHDTGGAIDVAVLEREQLRGSKSGGGGEDDHRSVDGTEPLGDRLDLLP